MNPFGKIKEKINSFIGNIKNINEKSVDVNEQINMLNKNGNDSIQEWIYDKIDEESLDKENKLKIWVKNKNNLVSKYCTGSGINLDNPKIGLSLSSIKSINWAEEINELLKNGWDGKDMSDSIKKFISNKYGIGKSAKELSTIVSDDLFCEKIDLKEIEDKILTNLEQNNYVLIDEGKISIGKFSLSSFLRRIENPDLVNRVILNENIYPYELIGHFLPVDNRNNLNEEDFFLTDLSLSNKSYIFKKCDFLKYIEKGGYLILDRVDKLGKNDMLEISNILKNKKCILREFDGRTIEFNSNLKIIATVNSSHSGTNKLIPEIKKLFVEI